MMKKEYGDCLSLSSLDYEYIKPPRECQEDTCYGVWLGTLGAVLLYVAICRYKMWVICRYKEGFVI